MQKTTRPACKEVEIHQISLIEEVTEPETSVKKKKHSIERSFLYRANSKENLTVESKTSSGKKCVGFSGH